jgi:hypothetical protein
MITSKERRKYIKQTFFIKWYSFRICQAGQTTATTMTDDKTRIQALAMANESAFYYNDHNTD